MLTNLGINPLRSVGPRFNIGPDMPKLDILRGSRIFNSYDMTMRRLEYQSELKDRKTMYSILDPILNIGAKERLARGTWYENVPVVGEVANVIHGYLDIGRRMFDIREPSQMLMTTLRFVGDTLDLTSTLTIKPFLHSYQYGTTLSDSYVEMLGLTGEGRYNYWFGDFNDSVEILPDNWAVNLLGEMLIDPSIWWTVGAAAIPSMAGANKKNLTKQLATQHLNDATKALTGKYSRTVITSFANPKKHAGHVTRVNRMAWRGDRIQFVDTMIKYGAEPGLLNAPVTRAAAETMYESAIRELGAKRFYRFLVSLDNIEMAMIRTIKQVTPITVTRKVLSQGWYKYKYRTVNESINTTHKAITKYNKLEKFDDFADVDLDELKASFVKADKELKDAKKLNDAKLFKNALDNYNEARANLLAKENYNQHKLYQVEKEAYERNIAFAKKEVDDAIKAGASEDVILDLQNKVEIQEALLAEAIHKSEGIKIFHENYNKIRAYVNSKKTYNIHEKGMVRSAKDLEIAKRKLEKLKKEMESITKTQAQKTGKYTEKLELEQQIIVYQAVNDILDFAMRDKVSASYLASIMNVRGNEKMRSAFLNLARGHFEVFEEGLNKNRKIIDQAIEVFKHSNKLKTDSQAMAGMSPNQIAEEISKNYLDTVKQLEVWDSIAKNDTYFETYLNARDQQFTAMLTGQYGYQDVVGRGVLGGFFDTIVKDILNELQDHLVLGSGSVNIEKSVDIINKHLSAVNVVGDKTQIAQLFNTLKTINKMFEASELKSKDRLISSRDRLRNMALKSSNMHDSIQQLSTKYNTNMRNELDTLYNALIEFQKEAKNLADPNTLLHPGAKYHYLAPFAGIKDATVEEPLHELSMLISANLHSSVKRTRFNNDISTIKKYLRLAKESDKQGNPTNYLLEDQIKLHKMKEIFLRSGLINRAENDVGPAIAFVKHTEFARLVRDSYENMNKLLNTYEGFNSSFSGYYASKNPQQDVLLKNLNKRLYSTKIARIDESIIDSMQLQHIIALEELHNYKTTSFSLTNDVDVDLATIKHNFATMIESIDAVDKLTGEKINIQPVLDSISEEEILRFTINLMQEVKESSYKIFDGFLKKNIKVQKEVNKITNEIKKSYDKALADKVIDDLVVDRIKKDISSLQEEVKKYQDLKTRKTLPKRMVDNKTGKVTTSSDLIRDAINKRYIRYSKILEEKEKQLQEYVESGVSSKYGSTLEEAKATIETELDTVSKRLKEIKDERRNLGILGEGTSRIDQTETKYTRNYSTYSSGQKAKKGAELTLHTIEYNKLHKRYLALLDDYKRLTTPRMSVKDLPTEQVDYLYKAVQGVKEKSKQHLTELEIAEVDRLFDSLQKGIDFEIEPHSVDLVMNIIYKQEYYPIYYVMQRIHNANFLLGGALNQSLGNMHKVIASLADIKTNPVTGLYEKLSPAIWNWLENNNKARYKKLVNMRENVRILPDLDKFKDYPTWKSVKNLDVEYQQELQKLVREYTDYHFKHVKNELEAVSQFNVLNIDRIGKTDPKNLERNVFQEMLTSVEGTGDVGDNYIFGNKLFKKPDKNYNVFDKYGNTYEGDLNFKTSRIIWFDSETTGVHSDAEVFQVGAVVVDPGKAPKYHNIYLRTKQNIDSKILEGTGHSKKGYEQLLAKQGHTGDNTPFQQELAGLIDNNTIMIAHNSQFDTKFLPQMFGNNIESNPAIIDSLPIMRLYIAETKNRIEKQLSIINDQINTTRKEQNLLEKSIENVEVKAKRIKRTLFIKDPEATYVKKTHKELMQKYKAGEKHYENLIKKREQYQAMLNKYDNIKNSKQETLIEELISPERKTQILDDLQKMYPDAIMKDHNALADATLLMEVTNSMVEVDDQITNSSLGEMLERLGINKISDLNKRQIGIMDTSDVKAIRLVINGTEETQGLMQKVNKLIDDLKELTQKPDTPEKIEKLDEGLDLSPATSTKEDEQILEALVNISEDLEKIDQQLSSGSISEINIMDLYNTFDEMYAYADDMTRNIEGLQYRVGSEIQYRSGKEGTPLQYVVGFSDLDNIKEYLNIRDEIGIIEEILDEVANREDVIANAIWGDVMGHLVDSSLFNHFKISTHFYNNDSLHTVYDIMRGVAPEGTSGFNETLAKSFNKVMRNELKNFGIEDIADTKLYSKYKEVVGDTPLNRLFNIVDDVQEYTDFTRDIYEDLYNRLKMASTPNEKETYRIGIAKVHEYMRKLETEYKKMVDVKKGTGERVLPEEFAFADMALLNDPDLGALVKAARFRDPKTGKARILPEYTGMDIMRKIDEFVSKRVQRYVNDGYNEVRLMTNMDTMASHEFYYTFKHFLLDPLSYVINDPNSQIPAADFKNFKELIQEALNNIRHPLKEIKDQSRNPENKFNLGHMNAYINDLQQQGLFYSDYLMHGQLPLENNKLAIRLSNTGTRRTALARKYFSLLEGLTDSPERLNSFVNSRPVSILNEKLDRLAQRLINDPNTNSDVLAQYFQRNTKRTEQRLIKADLLDSILSFQSNSKTIEEYNSAMRAIERWIKEESFEEGVSWISRKKDGTVDLEKAEEFMQRLKASVYDYLTEIEPYNYKKALGELYDQNFTKKELYMSKTRAARHMQEVGKTTNESYRELRKVFGDGPEGAQAMYDFIRRNPDEYSIVRFDFNSKSRTGVSVNKVRVKSPKDIMELDTLMSDHADGFGKTIGITDNNTYLRLQEQVGQTFKFKRNSAPDKIRRHFLMPLKSSMLFNTNFVFSNIFDAQLKNLLVQEGGMFSPDSVIGDITTARKMHQTYEEMWKLSQEVMPKKLVNYKYQEEWLDHLKERLIQTDRWTPEIETKWITAFEVNDFFKEKAAAGQFHEMLVSIEGSMIGKGKRNSDFENTMNVVFYGGKYSPFSWNMQLNSKVEIYSRLALHLNDTRKGLTNKESLNKVLKTHYNYTDKSKEEMYAEFVIPFMSFPIRSFLFWSDAFFANPRQAKNLSKLITRSWGQNVINDNDYAEYQAARGRLPIGDYSVNLGLTYMDAMSAMGGRENLPIPFADQALRKINPVARNLLEQSDRSTGERIGRMPIASQGLAMTGAVNAGLAGDRNLTNYAPAMLNSYYRGSFNTNFSQVRYRSSSFRTPYSYNTGNLIPNPTRSIRWRMTNLDRYRT